MSWSTHLICAFAAAAVLAVGCGGDAVPPTDGTQMSLAASPDAPITGSPVTFLVTAHNPETALKAVSIDFENDGTWDEEQSFDNTSISATFTHTYAAAGGFTVRAEVTDANNASTTRTLLLIVVTPANPPVSLRLTGGSGVAGGYCYAEGPPAACAGCSAGIDVTGISGALGSYPHGSPVSVTQSFRQDQFVTGTTTVRYDCAFSFDLYAGNAGSEVQFGHGACTTTSSDPQRLTCSITTSGTVP